MDWRFYQFCTRIRYQVCNYIKEKHISILAEFHELYVVQGRLPYYDSYLIWMTGIPSSKQTFKQFQIVILDQVYKEID